MKVLNVEGVVFLDPSRVGVKKLTLRSGLIKKKKKAKGIGSRTDRCKSGAGEVIVLMSKPDTR